MCAKGTWIEDAKVRHSPMPRPTARSPFVPADHARSREGAVRAAIPPGSRTGQKERREPLLALGLLESDNRSLVSGTRPIKREAVQSGSHHTSRLRRRRQPQKLRALRKSILWRTEFYGAWKLSGDWNLWPSTRIDLCKTESTFEFCEAPLHAMPRQGKPAGVEPQLLVAITNSVRAFSLLGPTRGSPPPRPRSRHGQPTRHLPGL